MDAFKLLTRSTNLARKGPIKSQSRNAIPSAGAATNPQLFGTHNVQNKATTLKRSQDQRQDSGIHGNDEEATRDVPKNIDFFNDAPLPTAPREKAEIVGHAANNDTSEDLYAGQNGTSLTLQEPQILPEDECRRILNAHKVKITELWSPLSPPLKDKNKDAKVKKRKRDDEDTAITSSIKTHKKQKMERIPQPLRSFSELRPRFNLSQRLAENIEAQGYAVPTEVQLAGLPLLLAEEAHKSEAANRINNESSTGISIDLLTVAPTGSGKTLAFLIPVLNSLLKYKASNTSTRLSGPRAIIVAPTKELASQIVNEGKKLALRTKVRVTLVRKGMTFRTDESSPTPRSEEEIEALNTGNGKLAPAVGADILVSTPLTLLHAISTANGDVGNLPSVQCLVLDEADVLLDELFREQTLKIWSACTNLSLRVSLWSATMGSSIEDLARSTIEERWHSLSTEHSQRVERVPIVRLVVGLKDSAIPNIQHKLVYAATEQGKLMALRQILRPTAAATDEMPRLRPPFLVFVQTIPRAIALHSELRYEIPQEAGGSSRIAVLHADLSDTAREVVMARFRRGEIWVLITTDLLSRGVDFRGVNGVVNYDFPNSSAAYVHRVGRTGRAGREGGIALTLYAKEDIPFVKNVANVIAAAERQKGVKDNVGGLQQWLLDAMPKPSKRDKQLLKKRGIESRRTGPPNGDNGNIANRTRISTKSGYERKMENKKRGAIKANQQKADESDDDDDFTGFDD